MSSETSSPPASTTITPLRTENILNWDGKTLVAVAVEASCGVFTVFHETSTGIPTLEAQDSSQSEIWAREGLPWMFVESLS